LCCRQTKKKKEKSNNKKPLKYKCLLVFFTDLVPVM
jgi:hypothetical protein